LDKRLPLALLLSFLVILAWSVLTKPPEGSTPRSGPAGGTPAATAPLTPAGAGEVVGERVADEEERELLLTFGEPGEPGSYEALFTNRGARLLRLRLGDYYVERGLDEEQRADVENWVELLSSIEGVKGPTGSLTLSAASSAGALITEPLEDALWVSRELEGGGIEFEYSPGTGVTFKKRVLPEAGRPELRLELEIANAGGAELPKLGQFRLTPAEIVRPVGNEQYYREPQVISVWRDDDGELHAESESQEAGGDTPVGSMPRPNDSVLSFAGVHNKFFACLLHPVDQASQRSVIGTGYRQVQDQGWLLEHPAEVKESWKFIACDLSLQLEVPGPGETRTWRFDLYAGPKQRELLTEAHPDHGVLVDHDLGFFDGIARVITALMSFYAGLVGNWGWGIILMTLTVRLLLFPLNRRAQTAMARFAKKMKRVQPMINEAKERYKNDPAKQRAAQSKIMQEEGAFPPLGGCLPMFLQLPVFFGLFQALRTGFDLRQQPFMLWMKDLSQPDMLAKIDLNTHLPFIETIEYLNILPILMVALWIAQHKVMPQPTASDPNADRTRKMMIAMQVFFAFLFYSYASGLALYMITSSSLAIFETVVIKKVWPIDDAEKPKQKSGFMARLAEAQKQQMRRLEEQQRRGGGGKKSRKKK